MGTSQLKTPLIYDICEYVAMQKLRKITEINPIEYFEHQLLYILVIMDIEQQYVSHTSNVMNTITINNLEH